ncbi:MAG: hypothetical protein QGG48_08490, partial [Desulfatiglandales bacterium]|nr:hypothetical protein [Desulfatiglandales bacterium]
LNASSPCANISFHPVDDRVVSSKPFYLLVSTGSMEFCFFFDGESGGCGVSFRKAAKPCPGTVGTDGFSTR